MATIYVATSGSDTSGTGSISLPYRTIGKATTSAVSGDTVHVTGDPAGALVYDETVTIKSGVYYLGDATYQPVLDSNYTKGAAFYNLAGPNNFTIDNFEIRRYSHFGIASEGSSQGDIHNNVIQNCHIHHIISSHIDLEYTYGCWLAYGNWTVQNCEIHHINGANESTGIWFGYCNDHVADGNIIYSIRKEGIRSYLGNLGRFVNNRIFLAWTGLTGDADAQSLWANNYISHCTCGINPKHTNDPEYVLSYWGLADDAALEYFRVWHNTIHRCSWGQMVLAVNLPGYMYKADVRNNIFSGRSPGFLWDAPTARLAPNIVDYNLYSTAQYGPVPYEGTPLISPIYKSGYGAHAPSEEKTLAQVRTDLGFELNGMVIDPQLFDPDNGNLDYPDSSPAHNAGLDLTSAGSEWGTQMGARGLPDSRVNYTPYLLSRYSSNTPYGFSLVDENLFNGDQNMPLGTWVVVDLGSSKPINHVFGDNLGGGDPSNSKRVRIELAENPAGPWQTVLDDETFDSGGTSWKFELPSAPSGRYAKVLFLTSWGSSTVSYYDIRLGYLSTAAVELYPSPTLYPSPALMPDWRPTSSADRRANLPTILIVDQRATTLRLDTRQTTVTLDA